MPDARLMDRKDLIDRVEHLEFCLREITEPAERPDVEGLPKCQGRLLGALISAKGRTVTHGALMAAIFWDRPEPDWPGGHILAVYVCHLRRALRESGSPLIIQCAWGRGYRVVAP